MTAQPSSVPSSWPILIQGGMGVAISTWRLARAVARRGHLGVVSGTAIDRVVAARLQEGDDSGHLRRAFDAFPNRELADRVYGRWHRPEGLPSPGAYKPVPMFSVSPPQDLLELAVLAAFAEVWLASEEKAGPVGINLLEKIQAPTLPVLYGALLAAVSYVLVGAGIPRDIPEHLYKLSRHEPTSLRLQVEGGSVEEVPFDPAIIGCSLPPLKRPKFLAIVSSLVLAMSLARSGGVDGFVVEGPQAGGHNAPPRGWRCDSGEEPVYGERDVPDLERVRKLGLPFWLAGAQGDRESWQNARSLGAEGVQVGTPFAFCSDSGMDNALRKRVLQAFLRGEATTRSEARGSPTGFPFRTVSLAGTEGGRSPDARARRTCQHGYLRSAFRKEDGTIGWRCAAEPVEQYLAKGGAQEDCEGRRCLCNGLLATAGHSYAMKEGGVELPLITSGLLDFERYLEGRADYDANVVIDSLGVLDGPLGNTGRAKPA